MSSIGRPACGQPVGWWGLQVKALSGIGLVAEGPVGDDLRGTIGASWLLLIADGFAGLTIGTGKGVEAFGRAHLLYVAGIGWGGGGGEAETIFGLEPGLRLRLGKVVMEGGVIVIPQRSERVSGTLERGLTRQQTWRLDWMPNVGLVVRLGRL